MTHLKEKLNFLFYKIGLKFYSGTKNLTKTPMPLDLIREEVQLLIFIIVTVELKLILTKLTDLSLREISPNLLIDNSIRFLAISSKEKVLRSLGFTLKTKLETSNAWILKNPLTYHHSLPTTHWPYLVIGHTSSLPPLIGHTLSLPSLIGHTSSFAIPRYRL